MRKWLLMLMAALMLTSSACAEPVDISWGDCYLTLPEGTAAPMVTWTDGAGEPGMVVINVPEKQRADVLAAIEAAPEWALDGTLDMDTALDLLRHMHCKELPELPESMTFERVCFWVETPDADDMDDEELAFMMALIIGGVALNDDQPIDIPLRIGFYDVDTGTLLMARWL